MAINVSLSGPYYAMDPCIITCSAPDNMEDGDTNRQIELRIYANSFVSSYSTVTWEFNGTDSVFYIDIQRGLRALLQQNYIMPPLEDVANKLSSKGQSGIVSWTAGVTFVILSGYVCMKNGVYFNEFDLGRGEKSSTADAYYGSNRKDEIYSNGTSVSSKPSTTEITSAFLPLITNSLSGTSATTTITPIKKESMPGYIYPDSSPYLRSILFINQHGFPELATVRSLPSVGIATPGARHNRTNPLSSSVARELMYIPDRFFKQWHMSSGPVSPEWAFWFANDMLRTRKAYLLDGGSWYPVTLTPDSSSVSFANYASTEPCEVRFTVRSNRPGILAEDPSVVNTATRNVTSSMYTFRFTGASGATREVTIESLPAEYLEVSSSVYEKVVDEGNSISIHKRARHGWKMSTGPVSPDVAEWYVNEFLGGSDHVLVHNGSSIPVIVMPDSSETKITDYASTTPSSVSFTVVIAS